MKVRFAPSPTGFLHVGNVRTALVNFLFAQKNGGHFLLRIDDTDTERSKPEYETAIKEDLAWLGIAWDSLEHQSKRFERYRLAAEKLRADNRLYACYETPEELDVQRKMLASRGLPPIYKRATAEQNKKYEAEGRRPHFRFSLNDEEIVWNDLIRGDTCFKATHMSDPVLIREDGVPVYTLASVVDDGEMDITHVIRGEDHVSNTAVQAQLYKALGFKVPEFAHMALLKTKDGEMSKRLGGNDIRSLREAGILPMAVNSLLAKIGTSDPVEAVAGMGDLIKSFDFKKMGRAPANYDVGELEKLNEKLLHQLPFSAVKNQLPFADESFWLSVRNNIKNLAEAKQWWDILQLPNIEDIKNVHGLYGWSIEDVGYLATALELLPETPWDLETWGKWTKALSEKTGRKGKELFRPLRVILTGYEHGPEMKILLSLMKRDSVIRRLQYPSKP